MPKRNKKNFRPTKSGAGMTKAGVAAYRRKNPGSKLQTAVTGKVKPGSKAAKRRKSFCARSTRADEEVPKAAKNPNSRLRQAREKVEVLDGYLSCSNASQLRGNRMEEKAGFTSTGDDARDLEIIRMGKGGKTKKKKV